MLIADDGGNDFMEKVRRDGDTFVDANRPPAVERSTTQAVTPADIIHLRPSLILLEHCDDLFIAEPAALHRIVLLHHSKAENPGSLRPGFRREGQKDRKGGWSFRKLGSVLFRQQKCGAAAIGFGGRGAGMLLRRNCSTCRGWPHSLWPGAKPCVRWAGFDPSYP
jgi:hypothetical protein